MLKPRTLNLFCSGPSGGKTTLILQAIQAHQKGESFFIPELIFPPGKVCIVSTDRSEETLTETLLTPMGIDPSQLLIISFLTEYDRLSNLPEVPLRAEISRRMKGQGIGTLILDLYEDFQSDNAASLKARGRDARANAHWAELENVAILGLTYPFKQTSMKKSVRLQDQISGSLGGQASAHTKLMLVGPEENGTAKSPEGEFWDLASVLGPGCGKGNTYRLSRSSATLIGLFENETSQQSPTPEVVRHYMETFEKVPKGTELTGPAIEDLTGLSRASCYRKIKEWVAVGYIEQKRHGLYVLKEIN